MSETKVGDLGRVFHELPLARGVWIGPFRGFWVTDGQKDVRRLEVAVDDALLMRMVHGPGNRLDQGGRLSRWLGRLAQLIAETGPGDELKGEKELTVMLADFENRHNVGMVQPSGHVGFAPESLARGRVGHVEPGHQLDGHAPAE